MKTRCIPRWVAGGRSVARLTLLISLLDLTRALAQPTIISTVPSDGATGVSTTAAVVFTFSEAMDTTQTSATFLDESTYEVLTNTSVWSSGNTVLSCTPSPAFPSNTAILWFVSGQNTVGIALGDNPPPEGTFTTVGSGGSGGGSGTNQYTSFGVGDLVQYDQTSAGATTPDTNAPYVFLADITLASNRTALAATLTLPSASVSNMTENPFEPEEYYLDVSSSNQTTLDTTFGSGNYVFTVVAASSNQMVTVNLPSSMTQPGAPQVTNYTAAQSVDPAQPFTLGWQGFAGGTSADFIIVQIGDVFSSPSPETSNALSGTATSIQIPADTLQTNMSYDSFISFYRINVTSNASGYTTAAYRASSTEFNLNTTGGATTPLVLTNASWSGHTFSFNVTSAMGQSLIIQYNTNVSHNASQWQTLLTTNSVTGVVQVTDSVNTSRPYVFYRAQAGP